MNLRNRAYWAVAIVSIFWGTTWVSSKYAIQYVPPLEMCAIRQFIAGSILLVYFIGKYKRIPSFAELLYHIILGFLFITCSNGLSTWAIKFIPSGLAALIGCLMPFAMAIVSKIVYNTSLNWKVMGALALGFIGVTIIFTDYIQVKNIDPNFYFGIGLALLSVVTWTISTLVSAKNKRNYNPYEGLAWQMFSAGITLFIISKLSGKYIPFTTIPLQAWGAIFYLILIGSIFTFSCYIYALQHLPTQLVSIYAYINPIIALILGGILMHEHQSIKVYIGTFITLTGVYLIKKNTAKEISEIN